MCKLFKHKHAFWDSLLLQHNQPPPVPLVVALLERYHCRLRIGLFLGDPLGSNWLSFSACPWHTIDTTVWTLLAAGATFSETAPTVCCQCFLCFWAPILSLLRSSFFFGAEGVFLERMPWWVGGRPTSTPSWWEGGGLTPSPGLPAQLCPQVTPDRNLFNDFRSIWVDFGWVHPPPPRDGWVQKTWVGVFRPGKKCQLTPC